MKKSNFLDKLKRESKLSLVEPSDEISASYFEKADNCLKSAKVVLRHNLYENSIIDSYYAMYDSLLALLFKVGIKSENHLASILLLERLFEKMDLFKIISSAKRERVDKQYYVGSKQSLISTEQSARDMLIKAEDFLIKIKLFTKDLNLSYTEKIRRKFDLLIN